MQKNHSLDKSKIRKLEKTPREYCKNHYWSPELYQLYIKQKIGKQLTKIHKEKERNEIIDTIIQEIGDKIVILKKHNN